MKASVVRDVSQKNLEWKPLKTTSVNLSRSHGVEKGETVTSHESDLEIDAGTSVTEASYIDVGHH